jgi:hypothetical protein
MLLISFLMWPDAQVYSYSGMVTCLGVR